MHRSFNKSEGSSTRSNEECLSWRYRARSCVLDESFSKKQGHRDAAVMQRWCNGDVLWKEEDLWCHLCSHSFRRMALGIAMQLSCNVKRRASLVVFIFLFTTRMNFIWSSWIKVQEDTVHNLFDKAKILWCSLMSGKKKHMHWCHEVSFSLLYLQCTVRCCLHLVKTFQIKWYWRWLT